MVSLPFLLEPEYGVLVAVSDMQLGHVSQRIWLQVSRDRDFEVTTGILAADVASGNAQVVYATVDPHDASGNKLQVASRLWPVGAY